MTYEPGDQLYAEPSVFGRILDFKEDHFEPCACQDDLPDGTDVWDAGWRWAPDLEIDWDRGLEIVDDADEMEDYRVPFASQ